MTTSSAVRSPSFLACCISTLAVLVAIFSSPNFIGERSPIQHDEKSYYGYLPALFIHHDVRLAYYAADTATHVTFIEPITTADGKHVLKMTCGVALFQLPFFLLAHAYSLLFDDPTGYSAPYKLMVILSGAFYGCTALFVLRVLLRRYFSEIVSAGVMLTLMLGTNLFWYTYFEAGLSHAYLFFAYVMVLWFTFRWHERASVFAAAGLGLFCGLAFLTRPTDGLIVLFPLLFGVYSRDSLQAKVRVLKAHPQHVLIAGVVFLLPTLLQMLYWHTATGHWIFYSYLDERLHLSRPHIVEGLISFRKGWFVYTPIMLFALVGMLLSYRKLQVMFYATTVFLVANVYVVFSWWCWWYGGSFGARALIESYAVAAFPLGVCYETLLSRPLRRAATLAAVAAAIALNLFQTYQYRHNIIDYERMTGRAYWFVFLKASLSDAERAEMQPLLERIDYSKALRGE